MRRVRRLRCTVVPNERRETEMFELWRLRNVLRVSR